MRSVPVTTSVTLDGVVQGLGRPDEDTRGGFAHGGWGTRYQDDVMAQEMAKGMSKPGDMLFGRRTWTDFGTVWGRREDGNPFTTHMNAATKYVASTSLRDASAWQNSVLLRGEATETVAELKTRPGKDLSVIGSASLVRSLHAAGLVDHYTLLIFPLTSSPSPAASRRRRASSSLTTTVAYRSLYDRRLPSILDYRGRTGSFR